MAEDDDDVPLLNGDDEQLITSNDRPPNVEAVFVVTFDVRDGNTVEFQMPDKQTFPLNGIEYKALPSGSHHVQEDFVYFRHGDRYGLACLARLDPKNEDDGAALSVIDQSERGLKIKSVGLLTSSIRSIQSYRPFLQREAKVYLHQSFVDYDRLKELLTVANTSVPFSLVSHDSLFFEFLQRFGPSIFPLSRLVLLGKRLLLYSSSPIGGLCDTVYFMHFLNPTLKSLFYVTVQDLPDLSHQSPYIACITEPIFKEKTSIYDIYIDCDRNKAIPRINFHSYNPILLSIAKITRYDRERFKRSITFSEFVHMGQQFFDFFDRLSKSSTVHQIGRADFDSLQLHPNSDYLFISEYLRLYPIPNVSLARSNPFIPCCSCPVQTINS